MLKDKVVPSSTRKSLSSLSEPTKASENSFAPHLSLLKGLMLASTESSKTGRSCVVGYPTNTEVLIGERAADTMLVDSQGSITAKEVGADSTERP